MRDPLGLQDNHRTTNKGRFSSFLLNSHFFHSLFITRGVVVVPGGPFPASA